MNHRTRFTALLLTAAILLPPTTAQAAAPTPSVSETMYVSLDAYGGYDNASIVKSYSTNGNTCITDHGCYTGIVNMSNYAEPTVSEDTVTFDLSGEEDCRRFYFEGKYDALPIALPWTIDLSYRLNGVPTAAEDLPGAAGVVEITLDIVPDPSSPEYFRNNLILEAAAMIDMDKELSVEAEGAQMQAVGNIQAVVYMVLPGEEQHYTLRIGTEDFAFSGFLLSMCPATLSQMDRITDLREAKEELEDSAEAANRSMDVILNTMNSLQGGLSATSDGLAGLDGARRTISGEKQTVQQSADAATDTLPKLIEALSPYDKDLVTLSTDLTALNGHLNAISDAVDKTAPKTEDIRKLIDQIQHELLDIEDMLDEAVDDYDRWETALSGLKKDCNTLCDELDDLQDGVSELKSAAGAFTRLLSVVGQGSGSAGIRQLIGKLAELPGALGGTPGSVITDPATGAPVATNDVGNSLVLNALAGVASTLEQISGSGAGVTDAVSTLSGQLNNSLSATSSLLGQMASVTDLLDDALENLNDHNDAFYDIIKTAYDTGGVLRQCTVLADTLDAELDNTLKTVNTVHTNALSAISDTRKVLASGITGLGSLHTFLKDAQSTLRKAGNQLDDGTKQTLNGLIDVLNRTVGGLAQTGVLKNSKDTIKGLVDDKWEEYTGEDNRILLMDTTAPAVSLTSAENISPDSVQIILRTAEITADEESDPSAVEEEFQTSGTIFSRIADIFRQLANTVCSLFG